MASNSFSDSTEEQYLIAGLASARESMASLDQANKELLEALQNSQEEIERLSMEGMNLQQRYRLQFEKINELEIAKENLEKENEILRQKLKTIEVNDISVDEIALAKVKEFNSLLIKIVSLQGLLSVAQNDLNKYSELKITYALLSERMLNLEKVIKNI